MSNLFLAELVEVAEVIKKKAVSEGTTYTQAARHVLEEDLGISAAIRFEFQVIGAANRASLLGADTRKGDPIVDGSSPRPSHNGGGGGALVPDTQAAQDIVANEILVQQVETARAWLNSAHIRDAYNHQTYFSDFNFDMLDFLQETDEAVVGGAEARIEGVIQTRRLMLNAGVTRVGNLTGKSLVDAQQFLLTVRRD